MQALFGAILLDPRQPVFGFCQAPMLARSRKPSTEVTPTIQSTDSRQLGIPGILPNQQVFGF